MTFKRGDVVFIDFMQHELREDGSRHHRHAIVLSMIPGYHDEAGHFIDYVYELLVGTKKTKLSSVWLHATKSVGSTD